MKEYIQSKINNYLKTHPKVAFGILALIIILVLFSQIKQIQQGDISVESEEMKAARYIINGQFMNQMIFRIMDRHRRCGSNQISGNVQYSKPVLIICGLIELMF